MLKQTLAITFIELRNFLNFNRLLHARSLKGIIKELPYLIMVILFLILLSIQICSQTYFLHKMNMVELIPDIIVLLMSFSTLFLSTIYLRDIIYVKKMNDELLTFPIDFKVIVVARLIKAYLIFLSLSLIIMVVHALSFAYTFEIGFNYYISLFIFTIISPLIPLTISIIFTTMNCVIASYLPNIRFAMAVLSTLTLLILVFLPNLLSPYNFVSFEDILINIESYFASTYPIIDMIGNNLYKGEIMDIIILALISVVAFSVASLFLLLSYKNTSEKLFAPTNIFKRVENVYNHNSALVSLIEKEKRQFINYPNYLTNTMLGPIIATVLACSLIFVNLEIIESYLRFKIVDIFVVVWAMVATILPTTACSISLEGKNFWLLRSFPIKIKKILDAKLIFNLMTLLPFYLISEVAMTIAFKPSLLGMLVQLLLPLLIVLLNLTNALHFDLKYPNFEWSVETEVVKCGIPVVLSVVMAVLICVLISTVIVFVPIVKIYIKTVVTLIMLPIVYIIYHSLEKYDIRKI